MKKNYCINCEETVKFIKGRCENCNEKYDDVVPASHRNYKFERDKFKYTEEDLRIAYTSGQLGEMFTPLLKP